MSPASESSAIVMVEGAALSTERALDLLAEARVALRTASLSEALQIEKDAGAMKAILRAQSAAKSAVNQARSVEREAKKRAGTMLAVMPKARGTRGQLKGNPVLLGGDTMSPPKEQAPTYADLGIDKKQASRLMKLAAEDDAPKPENSPAPPKSASRRTGSASAARKPRKDAVPEAVEAEIVRMVREHHQPHEIVAALGVKTSTVHYVKRKNGLGERAGDPLYRLREEVIEFRDALEGAANVAHRWEQATPEQSEALVKELGLLVRVARALTKRLRPQGEQS